MKYLAKRIALLCCLTIPGWAEQPNALPEGYAYDAYSAGYYAEDMTAEKAAADGRKLAAQDIADERYRLFVHGTRPRQPSPAELYLRETYAVYAVPIAFCCVTDGIRGLAEGYNAVMTAHLTRLHGRDIVAEAQAATRDAAQAAEAEAEARRIGVSGGVKRPLALPFSPGMTVLSAINACGGFTPGAAPDRVELHRQDMRIAFDADAAATDAARDVPLQPGDRITVPE